MRTILRLSVVCFALASAIQANATERIKWLGSLNQALAQAKKTDRLVMVDFYSDSCVWCKRLDQDTYPDPRVVNLAKNVYMVKLNVEDGREGSAVAQKYNVTGLPTILFFNKEGAVVAQTTGYTPPKEFSEKMQHAIDNQRNLAVWQAKYKSNPQDVANTARLAKVWVEMGSLQNAEQTTATLARYAPKDKEIARLYIEMGRHYAMGGDVWKAQPLFQKALANAKTPLDAATSDFFLGACAMNRHDKAAAKAYLTKAYTIPEAPEAMKQKAKQILDMIAKS